MMAAPSHYYFRETLKINIKKPSPERTHKDLDLRIDYTCTEKCSSTTSNNCKPYNDPFLETRGKPKKTSKL